MKSGLQDKKLLDSVRGKAWDSRNGLFVPRTEGDVKNQNWPVCGTCHRDVDAVEMKNANSFGVELWASCHGKEDWYTIKFPYRIEGDMNKNEHAMDSVRSAMRSFTPFQSSITL